MDENMEKKNDENVEENQEIKPEEKTEERPDMKPEAKPETKSEEKVAEKQEETLSEEEAAAQQKIIDDNNMWRAIGILMIGVLVFVILWFGAVGVMGLIRTKSRTISSIDVVGNQPLPEVLNYEEDEYGTRTNINENVKQAVINVGAYRFSNFNIKDYYYPEEEEYIDSTVSFLVELQEDDVKEAKKFIIRFYDSNDELLETLKEVKIENLLPYIPSPSYEPAQNPCADTARIEIEEVVTDDEPPVEETIEEEIEEPVEE